ncbi:MAG: NUDIX domain-containing protein [Eubacteriales bacterium]|nr:NUDIX domain-containing protein [Eubacteriales bacterium]
MNDCALMTKTDCFRFRGGGIIIRNNKMLFIENAVANYYYMIGGAVKLGEVSAHCVEREIYEEIGVDAKAGRLAVVCENLFKGTDHETEGLNCHHIEFYYIVTLDNYEAIDECTDIGERIVWIPIDKFQDYDIKPSFIRERIQEILASETPLHVVQN